MIPKDKAGMDVDVLAIICMDNWLKALAAPRLYRALAHPADPEVILKLLDIWIARAERADPESDDAFGWRFEAAPARALRDAVAHWKSPDVPDEVKAAARAVKRSMGQETARGGVSWDDYTYEVEEGRTLEDSFIWSEGLDEILAMMMRYGWRP
jgi:hypothetical protein